MRRLTTLAAAVALLSGCAMGPDYQAQPLDLPEEWPEHQVLDGDSGTEWQDWWTQFNDPTLNALVERSLDDNLNLQLQIQRIEQARAQLGLSRANRWPLLSAQAEATREQQPHTLMPPELGGGEPRNQFTVAGVLSYELDMWGRLARQREASGALLEQSVYGAEAVRLNLLADVVTRYFNLRSAEQQLSLAQQTLESREQSLALEELRHERGATNPLSVRQARAELEGTRALLPQLEQQVHMNRSALAMLVGYTPRELLSELDFGEGRLTDIQLPDSVPEVMPAELLRRRPDILAAESGLMAANAQVGVAMAERWPSLNLTALGGSAALDTSDLFTSPAQMWSLGAGLAGPLFDFGRGRARVDSAEAGRAQAETEYQLAVTSAFRDARDALTLYNTAEQRVQAIRRQTQAVAETVELAELQYEQGAIGFYELLDSQRRLLNAELELSQAMAERLTATATLFKAMGGGWSPETSQ